MRRLRVAVSCLAVAALVLPAGAWAHATVKQTIPGLAKRVQRSPAFVELRFDQSVKALPNAITVYTSKGKVVSGPARGGTDRRIVRAPVQHLPRGAFDRADGLLQDRERRQA